MMKGSDNAERKENHIESTAIHQIRVDVELKNIYTYRFPG